MGGARVEVSVLLVPEVLVDVAAVQQLLVAPDVVDGAPAPFTRIALAGTSIDRRWDTQMIGPLAGDARQVGVDDGFAFRVERAGRLVEDQHGRLEQQRAGERQPLALAAREVAGALLHAASRKPRGMRSMNSSSAPASWAARTIWLMEASGRAMEMFSRTVPLNRKFSCGTTPMLVRRCWMSFFAQVHAVDLDNAVVAGVQALQQAGDGRFAGAAAPHDAEDGPGLDLERDIRQGPRRARRVAESRPG